MIRLLSWRDSPASLSEFLMRNSHDLDLADETYFPSTSSEEVARRWLESEALSAWLILDDSTPVGIIAIVAPRADQVPYEFVETCTYISQANRGRGFAVSAWRLAEEELVGCYCGLAGIVWASNNVSKARLRVSGFQFTDRIWFDGSLGGERSGWCELWLKYL